jgi:deoxyribodipyrimidine photolyase-related protein
VVTRAEGAFRSGAAPSAAVEGFIRQVLGWREYVRGIYWDQMPGYDTLNALEHKLPLPPWFWTGQTYVSNATYIGRMSDYCKGCAYDKKQRVGDTACPFNALYWEFFDRHAARFKHNPRIGMAYRKLEKMSEAERDAIRAQAKALRAKINDL